MLVPFKKLKDNSGISIVLAGDVGATKTNLALIKFDGDKITVLKEAKYKSGDYKNIIELADSFVRDISLPDSICLGVAGPVLDGRARLSNINWEIDQT